MKAFIVCRDRVSYAQQCLEALQDSPGVGEIYLVDHRSTYLPMLDWLGAAAGAYLRGSYIGRVHVLWRDNAHPRDLWTNGTLSSVLRPGERFIVTDCDVVPDAPLDWVDHLSAVLDRYPSLAKAGLGLRVDDLPERYAHRERVQNWESQWTEAGRIMPCDGSLVFRSPVDTTLAMYRELGEFVMEPAARTTYPYLAQHLAWYENSARLTGEQRWYYEHATPGISHWQDPAAYEQAG